MCNKSASYSQSQEAQNFVNEILGDAAYMADRLHKICPLDVWQALDTAMYLKNETSTKSLIKKIERAAVYGVDYQKPRLDWMTKDEGKSYFVGECDFPETGRFRILDESVYRVHFNSLDIDSALQTIINIGYKLPPPVVFLGVKNQSIHKMEAGEGGSLSVARKCAVYLKGSTLEEGLNHTFGPIITAIVLKRDKGPDATFLATMLNAEGQRATHEAEFEMPLYMDDNEQFDGLLADLDQPNWTKFLRAFCLSPNTKWAQVRILSKQQGIVAKGAIRLCPDEDRVGCRTYTKSWKIGMHTGFLNTMDMIVCETDKTYKPGARMNLQVFAYNFTKEEQNLVIDEIIKPGLALLNNYEWLEKIPELERFRLAGGPLELIAKRVNELRKAMALDGISHQDMEGVRLKAAPWPGIGANMVLIPWWVRKHFCLNIGDTIDILRDPSLPCGNSIQRYTVAGVHNGNTIMLGREPWMTIQGGDFDGDDACLLIGLSKILPNKNWNDTPVKLLTPKKGDGEGMEPIKNLQDCNTRLWMAYKTMGAAIGLYDLAARRLAEIGQLDTPTSLLLSKGVQIEIDSMKHDVKTETIKVDVPKQIYNIDLIRRGSFNLVDRKCMYGPIVDLALKVYRDDIKQREYPKKEIQAKWKLFMESNPFPTATVTKAVNTSKGIGDAFAAICNMKRSDTNANTTDNNIRKLVGYTHEQINNLIAEFNEQSPLDSDTQDLFRLMVELAILKETSLFFGIRAVSMMTLAHVYGE